MGEKTCGDLYEKLETTISGNTIKLTGDIKTVKGWKEFSGNEEQQTGHFVPIIFPAECEGHELTFKNRKDGDRTITLDPDLTVITRMENLKNAKQEVYRDGKPYMVIDYTGLIPTGESAWDSQKTDFGRFGKVEALTDGLKWSWEGTTATPVGTIKYLGTSDREPYPKLNANGNWFPLALSSWYDGIPKTAGIKNPQETTAKDIVFKVESAHSAIKVTYLDVTVMEVTFTGMALEPCKGKNAVSVPGPEVDMGYVTAGELTDGDITIEWDGINGVVQGTLKEYQMAPEHFGGAKGHFLPVVVSGYDGKEIEYRGIGGATVKAADPQSIFQADEATPEKTARITAKTVPSVTLAELDLSKLVLQGSEE